MQLLVLALHPLLEVPVGLLESAITPRDVRALLSLRSLKSSFHPGRIHCSSPFEANLKAWSKFHFLPPAGISYSLLHRWAGCPSDWWKLLPVLLRNRLGLVLGSILLHPDFHARPAGCAPALPLSFSAAGSTRPPRLRGHVPAAWPGGLRGLGPLVHHRPQLVLPPTSHLVFCQAHAGWRPSPGRWGVPQLGGRVRHAGRGPGRQHDSWRGERPSWSWMLEPRFQAN
mmetsp:Transcript_92962/g.167946  ORF Transcript_92962/g.167946 Transcript_92962/m.167946 type:complete len:227 (-) Transcript_92962:90-770(-)